MEHFSALSLANASVRSDLLGQAYEYLIKKFADLTNKKAGEFYTPRAVVALMVRLLDPQPSETIYDPACGTGGMLLEAVHHVREAGGDERTLRGRLFGQEKNLTTEAIARMNLFMHGVEDFQIRRGDTLRHPAFHDGDGLSTFNCVIANPPFSLDKWGEDAWTADPWGRAFAGLPPAGNGDYAWLQHMIRSMDPKTGRMAVVLPHGALFRMGKEGRLRETILKLDELDAVIGLGPNLFYGTGLAACVLVFRRKRPKSRRGTTLVVDASAEFKKGRNQNELLPHHADRIAGWVEAHRDIEGIARVVTLQEFEENGFNLNIPRYVEPADDGDTPSVVEATATLRARLDAAWAAEDRLLALLREEGLAE